MNKNHMIILCVVFIGALFLIGCAAGPNSAAHTPNSDGSMAGFWFGLWHGLISPITFVISLFSDNVHFYEVHNNGGWYNFGFVLGAGILFGGSGRASSD